MRFFVKSISRKKSLCENDFTKKIMFFFREKGRGRGQKYQKMVDIIYGRPQTGFYASRHASN